MVLDDLDDAAARRGHEMTAQVDAEIEGMDEAHARATLRQRLWEAWSAAGWWREHYRLDCGKESKPYQRGRDDEKAVWQQHVGRLCSELQEQREELRVRARAIRKQRDTIRDLTQRLAAAQAAIREANEMLTAERVRRSVRANPQQAGPTQKQIEEARALLSPSRQVPGMGEAAWRG